MKKILTFAFLLISMETSGQVSKPVPTPVIAEPLSCPVGNLWQIQPGFSGAGNIYGNSGASSTACALISQPSSAPGTVTSVALVGSGDLFSTTPGTAVIAAGNLNADTQLQTQTANCVVAGPSSGSAAQPTCRPLVAADIPSLSGSYLPLAGGTMTGPTFFSGYQVAQQTVQNLGPIPAKYYSAYQTVGDSWSTLPPTGVGTGAGYGTQMASFMNASLTTYSISGSQACDVNRNQVFPNQSPGNTGNPLYSVEAGVNDAHYKGVGSYEAVFELCQQASLSWLSLPSGSKVLGNNAAVTSSGFSTDSVFSYAIASTTNGSTASFPITSYGGPLVIWYRIMDGDAGVFTYSVDGGSAVSVNGFTSPAISTNLGTTNAVGAVLVSAPAAGSHTVAIAVTSATGGFNLVSILGVGTTPITNYYEQPSVVAFGTPYQENNTEAAATAAYNADTLSVVSTLSTASLPVFFYNIRNYIFGTPAEMSDQFHPNAAGYIEVFQGLQALVQPIPNRAATVSSTGGDTACAMAADSTIHAVTPTAGSSTSSTFTFTVSSASADYFVGQKIQGQGNMPTGYNGGPFTITATTGTTVTVSSTNNPGTMTGFGTFSLYCGNQTTDALASTAYSFTNVYSTPAGFYANGPPIKLVSFFNFYSSSAPPNQTIQLATSSGGIYVPKGPFTPAGSYVGINGAWTWELTPISPYAVVTTLTAHTDIATSTAADNSFANQMLQPITYPSSTTNLFPKAYWAATGVASGTYTSGITAIGTIGQTCNLTSFNDSSTATATVALTGTNTIAGGTALVITSRGQSASAAPTSATAGNGTATCTGTATIATVLGGSPGNALTQTSLVARTN